MSPRPIAVVLEGPPTPAWQQRALSELEESPLLDVVEVRIDGPLHRSLAQRFHTRIEQLMYPSADALAPVLVDRPQTPRASSATLVIWLTERLVPEDEHRDLLYLRHGHVVQSAEEAFSHATLGGASCVETEVLLRSAADTVVVERTVSGVRDFSVTLGLNHMLWKTAALIRRAAERAPGLDLPAAAPELARSGPSSARLIARAARTWLRVLATRLLFRRVWSIRVRERRPVATKGWSTDDRLVCWKPGHIHADPFLIEHEGRHHLFCEQVPFGSDRGVIAHTELGLDGLADPPAPVLERPYHLSYPFVFAHEGEMFMIPETSSVRRVELYRALEFPHEWRREAILLDDLDATDATLLRYGDRLWLFATVPAPGASKLDELHVFWATSLQGVWHPHARNPVVSDARCARPGGAIQQWGARLVRPGQDGSRRYGGAVSFREIDTLSTTEYAEHEVDRLQPDALGDARAIHTYASDGRFEAIDLRRRELRTAKRVGLDSRAKLDAPG